MARKTVVQLADDLDGVADESVQTVNFSLDGVQYEIDLNPDNADVLRSRLGEYISSARRTNGRRRSGRQTSRSNRDREISRKIRQWAAANDWEISHRGRLPLDIVDAYRQATAATDKRRRR